MANNCTPNVQAYIEDLYSLGRFRAPAGAVELATSQANGAAVQAQMIQRNGKNSVYSITYVNGACDEPISCGSFDCTATDEADTLTSCDTFNSFSCKTLGYKPLAIASLRDLGSASTQQMFAARLWDHMQKMKAAVDVELVTAICAAGTTTGTLNLLNALGGANFSAEGDIFADFADNGFAGVRPLLLGNRQTWRFAQAISAGAVNSGGLNLAQMQGFPTFYDNNVVDANCMPSAPGNEVMLAVLPGIVNHLSWSANAGVFASRQDVQRWDNIDPTTLIREGDTYSHTVVEDPSTGLLFDLDIVYDPRCKGWVYNLTHYYKHLLLPVTGCVDENFAGVIKYDVCPPVAVECAPAEPE